MEYKEAVSFLISNFPQYQKVGIEGYKPYPERMLSLMDWLGNPQQQYPSIHIAGTNGKGSTAHMLAAVLQSAGLRTGLYTSPHLTDFRERIKIDGQMIPAADVAAFISLYAQEKMPENKEEQPSFFDLTTAMAFHYFAGQKADVAVIETGLGGRLDSTNILEADSVILSIITNIGLDHCDLLGNTLEEIAQEKAGIIKAGIPVVAGEYDPAAFPVIASRATEKGAPLYRAFERPPVPYRLEGDTLYQQKNLKTVLCAIDVLRERRPDMALLLNPEAVTAGLEHFESMTGLHGRWEHLACRPAVIADTGHNAHGMKYLKQQLSRESFRELFFVLGVVRGKDLASMAPLLPADAYYFFTQAAIPRALPFSELASWGREAGFRGEAVPTVGEAFEKACGAASPEDLILIGGSTFTVADVMENFFCRVKN